MKRTYYLIFTLLFLTGISCQDNLVNNNQKKDDQKELIIDEVLQSVFVDELLQEIDIYSELGESLTKSAEIEGGCPMVTIERPGSEPFWPRTITLDFGEGCEKNGKIKSGIMVIEKSAPWNKPGALRKVTFQNYAVDGVSIAGEKELVNISEKEGDPTFEIKAELILTHVNKDGKEVVVTREVSKTQEWLEGYRDKEVLNQILLTGKSEIVRKVGDAEKTIEKEYNSILIVQGCRFPQSGVTRFEVNTYDDLKLEFAMDYGTSGSEETKCGENCDCTATLSWGTEDEGGSEDIDLSVRWWKKARENNNDD